MTDLLKSLTVRPDATLLEAMGVINSGAKQVALVIDETGRLLATVTDGDIRRGLLRGVGLDEPVSDVMHTQFTAVSVTQGRDAARRVMQERSLHHVPIIDPNGRLVDLAHVNDVAGISRRETQVILMAGGLGTRLRPLTETLPKPMLQIGGRPILEIILNNLIDQGFHNFTLSLNYKAEMIEEHFGDGSEMGASIKYLREDRRMGTAGALSLLPERPSAPFIVMNGDLLTTLKFGVLVDFHGETGSRATMCAREFNMVVPFGVVEFDGTKFRSIVEKPVHSHFVNAGIYVLSPEALDHLEPDQPCDMPDLFDRIALNGDSASVYPVAEYWIDIGRLDDLERARSEFDETF